MYYDSSMKEAWREIHIEVQTARERVFLQQSSPPLLSSRPDRIEIEIDQIDQVIAALKEAKAKIEAAQK